VVGVLLPFLSLIGLVILATLKDKNPEPVAGVGTLGTSSETAKGGKLQKATTGDIVLSLILPGWGLLVGLIALVKGEARRAFTMMALSAVLISVYVVYRLNSNSEAPVQASAPQPSLETQLTALANQVSLSAPKNVDDDTRLDGAVAGPGAKLSYRFTLLKYKAADIDPAAFDTKVAPGIRDENCKLADVRNLIARGVLVSLEYRGIDGALVSTVPLDSASCASKSGAI
jgi:hypothetical protein